jgi:hypothetical protein
MNLEGDFYCFNNFYSDEKLLLGQLQIQHKLLIKKFTQIQLTLFFMCIK